MNAIPESAAEAGAGELPEHEKRDWKSVALVGGGFILTAAGAVVATLAATHKSAVTENAIAYVNGFTDGLSAAVNEGLLVREVFDY